MGSVFRLLLAPFVAVAVASGTAAQAPPPQAPPPPDVRPVDDSRGTAPRPDARAEGLPEAHQRPPDPAPAFALARRYLEAGQPERAIALLEDLHAADPASYAVFQALREAYERARRYDDALALLDRRLAAQRSPDLLAERGATLYRAGRHDAARQAWEDALALAPRAEQTYRSVANVVAELRLYAEAAAYLERGREALGRPALYAFERANLYGLAGDHARAADAYLAAIAEAPEPRQAVQVVQDRLARLVTDRGAPEAFTAAVERAIRQDPLNRSYRELAAWLAAERRDWAAALEATLAIDRLAREEGQSVLAFAMQARAAGEHAQAARALAYVLERHPASASVPPALVEQARLSDDAARAAGESRRTGRPTPHADVARQAYRDFAARFEGRREGAAALRRLALLERDVYLDFAAADTLLARVAAFGGPETDLARLERAELALLRGDLYAARAAFASLEEELRLGPVAEQARFELAQIDFYDGYVLSALAQLEAMGENTAADVANDALSLRLTLREGTGPDDAATDALRGYARAHLLHRRALDRDALATLDSLGATLEADHPLADQALFLRALVLRSMGRAADADAALATLPARFPDSFYRDRALMLRADLAARELADPEAERRAYLALLEHHPGSLFAPEARARLRARRPEG
ncbi:MAG: tetratricopeptide repeat protein [Rubricoccaceae bacterium]